MSDIKSVLDALNKEEELEKENQKVVLKEYGEKVKALDAEIKGLIAEKESLVEEIKILANQKDSVSNKLLSEANEKNEKARGVLQEAEKKMSDLVAKEIALSNDYAEKDKKMSDRSKLLNDLIDKAEENLLKHSALVKETEAKLKDAAKHQESVLIKENEVEKLVEKLKIEKTELENNNLKAKELQADLDVKINESKKSALDLDQKIQYERDAISVIENQKQILEGKRKEYEERKIELEKEYQEKYEILKNQASVNSARSKELDAGFSVLNEKGMYVEKEIKKLEEIRAQLSK